MKLTSSKGNSVPPRPCLSKEIKIQGIKAYFDKHSFSAFGIDSENEYNVDKFCKDYASHYYGHCDGYEMAKDLERDGWDCDREWIDELEAIGSYIFEAERNAVHEWVKAYSPLPPFSIGLFITNGLITGIDEVDARYQVKVKGGDARSRRLVKFEDAELDKAAMDLMAEFVATADERLKTTSLRKQAYKLAFIIDLDVGALTPHVKLNPGLTVSYEFYKETVKRLLNIEVNLKPKALASTKCVFECKVGAFENERYVNLDAQFFEETEGFDLVKFLPYEALARVVSSHSMSYMSDLKMHPTPIRDALNRQIERNKSREEKEPESV